MVAVQEAGPEGREALVGVRLLRHSVVVVAVAVVGDAAAEVATVDFVVAVGEAALQVVAEVGDEVAIAPWTIRLVRAMEAVACSTRRADIALRLHC